MSRWFRSAVKGQNPMIAEDEMRYLRDAEEALMLLLNDDIEKADKILKEQDSSFHLLGRGISAFLASMLGGEKDLMKNASVLLQAAETRTWEDMKKAEKEPDAFQSAIYPPGTEYAVCFSIAMLTSAITSVLSGSITEAVKGFYKLRRAYQTLEGILEIEAAFIKRRRANLGPSGSTPTEGVANGVGSRPSSKAGSTKSNSSGVATPGFTSNRNSSDLARTEEELLKAIEAGNPDTSTAETTSSYKPSRKLDLDPAMISKALTSHIDIFIYSGSHVCFGLLLIVLSMVENPVFNRILYIVGFKGDRERGVEMLWQATKFENFNSATAGLGLLGYYNGLVGFCDILPTDAAAEDDLSGYPRARCKALLAEMVRLNPESKLWKLEEARSMSFERRLGDAIVVLKENTESNMKQIATINIFEKSLTTMFYHDYQEAANSWLMCAELNTWSPTLYHYMAGCAYVELYRNALLSNPQAAVNFKTKATENIRQAPSFAGKQKVMSKQLPFDIYITRKVQKWEERAKEWDVEFIDAIGVSPILEMIYLWNGLKKMSSVELEKSWSAVQWERTKLPEKFKADFDEAAMHHLLQACVLRNMRKFSEARDILETELLIHDRLKFKGPLKDDWTCPAAHYEMACLSWFEKDLEGEDHTAKVLDCEEWLQKTQTFESYVLDTRMSIKITTSVATVKRHKAIMAI
ncbi:outer membrane protein-like protein iml2 [Coleophoma cylindrospora]|uniref:Inclusion body clearance protein IML2 n=1 Tax=Coleophoma cylindrospora TaxID=1849047 RepID=A0A3D8QWN3_9HELO|nr:outer membrane protein-like protein iml2 [Coleophoma cylindrospora]